jgi:predicted lipoprotein with Yx(FWY)xxD motif
MQGEIAMNNTMTRSAYVAAALLLSITTVSAAEMLTNKDGMTLYVFDKDKDGISTCYGDCAVKWPAYMGKDGDKLEEGWTLAKRTDGTMQLAVDGKPTYLFLDDIKKGDKAGDGVGGVWHIIER